MKNKMLCFLFATSIFVMMFSSGVQAIAAVETKIPLAKLENYEVSAGIVWQDEWFLQNATEYNQELAAVAVALSSAAYIDKAPDSLSSVLVALGFEAESMFSDYTEPTIAVNDIASYVIAQKQLKNGEKNERLVTIVIKGTSGNEEWISNLNIGEDNEKHLGFSVASTKIYLSLLDYCKEKKINPAETKFLVTGHSRGAGVANILGMTITEVSGANPNDVFCYTFASPRTTKAMDAGKYKNVFNIISPEDSVTIIPFAEWGYRRYGVDMILPKRGFLLPEKITALENKNAAAVQALVGMTLPKNISGVIATQRITDNLKNRVPNVYTFNQIMKNSGFNFSDYFTDRSNGDDSDGMMMGLFSVLGAGSVVDNARRDLQNIDPDKIKNGVNEVEQSAGAVMSHASFLYFTQLASTTADELFENYSPEMGYTYMRKVILGPVKVEVYEQAGGSLLCTIGDSVTGDPGLAVYCEGSAKYIDYPLGVGYIFNIIPIGVGEITDETSILRLDSEGVTVLGNTKKKIENNFLPIETEEITDKAPAEPDVHLDEAVKDDEIKEHGPSWELLLAVAIIVFAAGVVFCAFYIRKKKSNH